MQIFLLKNKRRMMFFYPEFHLWQAFGGQSRTYGKPSVDNGESLRRLADSLKSCISIQILFYAWASLPIYMQAC
jgi:hypothetical protein